MKGSVPKENLICPVFHRFGKTQYASPWTNAVKMKSSATKENLACHASPTINAVEMKGRAAKENLTCPLIHRFGKSQNASPWANAVEMKSSAAKVTFFVSQ